MKPSVGQIVLVVAILNSAAFIVTVIVTKLLLAWIEGHS